MALNIDFHAVRHPNPVVYQGRKHPVRRQRQKARGFNVKRPNMTPLGVIDVEDRLVR